MSGNRPSAAGDLTVVHLPRRMLAVIAAVVGVVTLGWSGGVVTAHAELLEITPADGAIVATAPAEVVLRWSEPVSLTGGSARVLDDAAGVVSGEPVIDGTTLSIPLPAGLAAGTYTVAWDVISEDSHPISGATVFHVGAPSTTGPVDVAGVGGAGWGVRAGAAVLTTLAYGGALVAVGAWWFLQAGGLWDPSMRRRLGALVERAAVLGTVSIVAAVPLRIARLGGGLGALRDNDLLAESLKGPIGVSSLVSAIALLVLAGMAGREGDGRVLDAVGVLAGLVGLAGFAFEGHTRSQEPRTLMVALDVVHLTAAAVWLGGIAALALAFRARLRPDALGRLVVRFSGLAVVAVVAVVAAGVGMAWIVLPSFGDLFTTGYGLALVTKALLVVPVIGLGAYNRRRLVPAMSAGAAAPDDRRRRLGLIVSVELALLVAVVGVTSVLVTRSPIASSATPPPATIVPPGAEEVALSGGAGTVRYAVAPARSGQNEITLALTDAAGRPLVPVEVPTVELTEPALGVGPLRPVVHPLADGQYHVIADIPLAGTYAMVIRVRVSAFDAATADVTVPIS
jgi:copper transport protein